MRSLILAALLTLALAVPGLADVLEVRVFQLYNRMPTTAVEAVRVALSPQGTVVPDDRTQTMIVKDTPEALSRVQALIERIDVALPQVRVKVAFSGGTARSGGAAGAVYDPRTGRIYGGGAFGSGSATVGAEQNVLVMSGEEARIEVGRDLVQVQPYWTLAQNYGLIPPGVIFQQVSTGFAVSPRVSGEAITLTVTPWISYEGPGGTGDLRFAESATTVSLRSGDALTISSGMGSGHRQGNVFGTILGFGSVNTAEAMSIVLTAKVEPDWSLPREPASEAK